jgi:hypothetical protein
MARTRTLVIQSGLATFPFRIGTVRSAVKNWLTFFGHIRDQKKMTLEVSWNAVGVFYYHVDVF